MNIREIFSDLTSLKIWEWDFPQLERAITDTCFYLTPHSMLTLWRTRANCLGTSTCRVNNPKITNLWTLPPRCLQLRTAWNMKQNLWQNYVHMFMSLWPILILSCSQSLSRNSFKTKSSLWPVFILSCHVSLDLRTVIASEFLNGTLYRFYLFRWRFRSYLLHPSKNEAATLGVVDYCRKLLTCWINNWLSD
jgi:hypothetical protein